MPSIKLPILTLAVREQHYSCHGCGNCCRDFTVQLRDEDLAKLKSQDWEQKLGHPVTIRFRGMTYLRQRDDGACVFLMDDGRCRIHAEFGFEAKPIACQLFPFHLTPTSSGPGNGGVAMGINFTCQSVLENKGADLHSHQSDLRKMAAQLPEVSGGSTPPPMLTDALRATQREVDSLVTHIDQWLRDTSVSLAVRLDGLAWVIASLTKATLENVRDARFSDLLDVLFGALPDELEHHPFEPPTARQKRMLRLAVFARTEDPKLNIIAKQGGLRLRWNQLQRSRRYKSGRGPVPRVGEGWSDQVPLESIESVRPASEIQDAAAIDGLMTRYLRASILGGRCWGPGYYGWSVIAGLQALLLNAAVVGWLARVHASGRGQAAIDITAARAALGRVDRTAGRAAWLGGATERLRLRYFNVDEGLRRLVSAYSTIATDTVAAIQK